MATATPVKSVKPSNPAPTKVDKLESFVERYSPYDDSQPVGAVTNLLDFR